MANDEYWQVGSRSNNMDCFNNFQPKNLANIPVHIIQDFHLTLKSYLHVKPTPQLSQQTFIDKKQNDR